MRFSQWIDRNGGASNRSRRRIWAAKLSIHIDTLDRIAREQRFPNRETMSAIYELTDQEVTPNDFHQLHYPEGYIQPDPRESDAHVG